MKKLSLIFISACLCVIPNQLAHAQDTAPQRPQKAPWFAHNKAENFNELKHIVADLIGRAESRVILYTEFLTDGEISSALFLAQYRKIQTIVFLGGSSMNRYLSRLGYLKAQNIPVFVRPRQSQFREPTILLVDRHLYRISRDLDVLKKQVGAEIQLASPSWVNRFEAELVEALKNNKQAIPKPLPMVGRPGSHPQSRQNVPIDYQGDPDGTYNYDRAAGRRKSVPAGVPTKLPKTTVFEQRQRMLENKQTSPSQTSEQVASPKNVSQQAPATIDIDLTPSPGVDQKPEDASSSSEEWFDVD
ncbi:MAG: hypothetical protein ACOH5I_11615 [Oligoflexus sp.]